MPENRKSRMTKRLFHEAMIELMREKPIGKISVKEICEQADLNRSTFYAHYTDPFDLLKEIEDYFMQYHTAAVGADQGSIENSLEQYLSALQKDDHSLALLIRQDPDFRERILQSTHMLYTSDAQLAKYGNSTDIEQKLDFIASGSMYLIERWLKDPAASDSRKFAALITKMMKAVVSL